MFEVSLLQHLQTEKVKYPSNEKWITKLWHIYIMKFNTAIKGNELLIHVTTWINLKNFMLNQRTRHKKSIFYHSIYMKF